MNSRRSFLRNSIFSALSAPSILSASADNLRVPYQQPSIGSKDLHVFSTSGQEVMRLNSNGGIGIGSSSPKQKLKVRTV